MTTIVDGVEIEVEYKYYPPCRGARGSYGEPLEPDEPETVELLEVTIGGQDVYQLLSNKQLEQIEEQCLREANNGDY